MTGFDIAVLICIGTGAVVGFMRGFVQECLALLAWIFAIFAIHNLLTPMTNFLLRYIHSVTDAEVLGFALLLLVPYGVTKLLAGHLGKASRNSSIGPVDRVLGFGFGAVKGTVVVVLAFSLLVLGYDVTWGSNGRPDWIVLSRTYPFINACSDKLVEVISARRHEAAEAAASSADQQ